MSPRTDAPASAFSFSSRKRDPLPRRSIGTGGISKCRHSCADLHIGTVRSTLPQLRPNITLRLAACDAL